MLRKDERGHEIKMNKLIATEKGYKFAEDIELEDADAVILELKEYQDLNKKNKILEEKILDLEQLNYNLLRINKERANAKRGLKPKKEHTGYIVLNQEEACLRFQKEGCWEEINCWRICIQTPLDSLLKLDKKVILQGIQDSFGLEQDLILHKNRLTRKEFYKLWDKIQQDQIQIILKTKYKANNLSELWEVYCWIPFFLDTLNKNINKPSKLQEFKELSKTINKAVDKKIAEEKKMYLQK